MQPCMYVYCTMLRVAYLITLRVPWGPVQMLLVSTIMLICNFAHYAQLCSLNCHEICPIMLRKSSKISKKPRVQRPRAELLALLGIPAPSGLQKR